MTGLADGGPSVGGLADGGLADGGRAAAAPRRGDRVPRPARTPFDHLATVDLAGLEETASLLQRRDRKYVVPLEVVAELVERLGGGIRVLQIDGRRMFRYQSVYFDTPGSSSYLAAARRRSRRYKVRTRAYLDAGHCLLEVKTRDPRGRTIKERRGHALERADRLDAGDRPFLGGWSEIGTDVADLEPSLTTSYVRTTLLLEAEDARVTIDTDVQGQLPDGSTAALAGMAIVETKSAGPPSSADRILWSLGHRPTRISKYCTSLAALRRELPSNRWTRALRQPWIVREAGATSTSASGSRLALAG